MSNCYLVCGDCDCEFSVPSSSCDPSKEVCPKCSSTKIYQMFGGVNSQCIDAMKECSACDLKSNCNASL